MFKTYHCRFISEAWTRVVDAAKLCRIIPHHGNDFSLFGEEEKQSRDSRARKWKKARAVNNEDLYRPGDVISPFTTTTGMYIGTPSPGATFALRVVLNIESHVPSHDRKEISYVLRANAEGPDIARFSRAYSKRTLGFLGSSCIFRSECKWK